MPKYVGVTLLLWNLFTVSSADVATLSKPQIERVLAEMESALLRQDAAGVVQYFSDDIDITLQITTPQGTETVHMDKAAYLESLQQSFQDGSDYHYDRLSTTIELSADGQTAIVAVAVKEQVTLGSEVMEAQSQQVSHFRASPNGPEITRVAARAIIRVSARRHGA
jgi:ketosteroid isomerase-like protein